MTHDERVAALRARLEAKHEEIMAGLHALLGAENEDQSGTTDYLFLLLGHITYWQSLPRPSEKGIETVNRLLDRFRVEVRTMGAS